MAKVQKEDIIKKLGIESLDAEAQQQALENVANVVSTRLWRKIAGTLTEEDLDAIESLMREEKNDDIEKLIKSKFPNYEEFAITTENEIIEDMAKDKKSIEENLKKLKST